MINNEMTENKIKDEEKNNEKKPNESAGFYFSSFVKIFDPNSQEVLVQKRGDI